LYTFGSFGSPPEAYWDLCLKKEPESALIFLLLGTGGTVEDLLELCLLSFISTVVASFESYKGLQQVKIQLGIWKI
jgi:hypothetical protein